MSRSSSYRAIMSVSSRISSSRVLRASAFMRLRSTPVSLSLASRYLQTSTIEYEMLVLIIFFLNRRTLYHYSDGSLWVCRRSIEKVPGPHLWAYRLLCSSGRKLSQEAVALLIPDAVPMVNLFPVIRLKWKFLMKIQTLLETTFLGLERVADAADGGASIWLIGDCWTCRNVWIVLEPPSSSEGSSGNLPFFSR